MCDNERQPHLRGNRRRVLTGEFESYVRPPEKATLVQGPEPH
jgi:hypothetical protein